jgi:hypothetical protein
VAILNLISGPRNISTALMYSFAQRNDTVVLDEPFYAVYLLQSGVEHPGKDQVLESLPNTENGVRSLIESTTAEVLFVKNMAHHMEVLDSPWINDALNIFLIRNPIQIISSYAEVIKTPVMRDIGIEYQFRLFNQLTESGREPIVLDTGLLLDNPEAVLRKLCSARNLMFKQQMLYWPKGPKSYDGVWATHWYGNVHASTGFERQKTSSRELPSHLKKLCDEALFYYEKLSPFSLKA